ncbi:hypothetical protein ACFQZV_02460 [Microbacterium koreense]|uniref:Uncharacterized protein n=1 Tax=Microbacterium koreense TaxID=323761 RepID=A0ABW2ZNS8_9MICO
MTGVPQSAVEFDSGPLVDRVDRRAMRDFARRLKEQDKKRRQNEPGPRHPSSAKVGAIVFGSLAFLLFLAGARTLAGALADALTGLGVSDTLALVSGVSCFIAFAAGCAVAVVLIVRHFARRNTVRQYRLDRFARANGMTYRARRNVTPLPGMIFGHGSSRHTLDVVRGKKPRPIEIANYRYIEGMGENATQHKWGYVAVKLDVPLPHIVLDAVGNNGLFGSNLPTSFDRDQRLSLEGDFDRYFSLYCPTGYERDALYLFTPDIMARVIDHAAAVDIEIVDDWLFLYAKRDFTTLDPAMWAWLFSLVAALLDKLAQWERWRDDRLPTPTITPAAQQAPTDAATDVAASLRPPPGVAASGRRLKWGISWRFIAFIAVVLAWFALPHIVDFFATLGG